MSAYYDGNARSASAFMAEIQQYAADRQSTLSTSSRANAKATKTITSRIGKNGSTSSSSSTTPKSRFGPAPTGSNYRNDVVTGGGGGGASDDESEQFFDAHEYDYFDSDENEPPQAKRRL